MSLESDYLEALDLLRTPREQLLFSFMVAGAMAALVHGRDDGGLTTPALVRGLLRYARLYRRAPSLDVERINQALASVREHVVTELRRE